MSASRPGAARLLRCAIALAALAALSAVEPVSLSQARALVAAADGKQIQVMLDLGDGSRPFTVRRDERGAVVATAVNQLSEALYRIVIEGSFEVPTTEERLASLDDRFLIPDDPVLPEDLTRPAEPTVEVRRIVVEHPDGPSATALLGQDALVFRWFDRDGAEIDPPRGAVVPGLAQVETLARHGAELAVGDEAVAGVDLDRRQAFFLVQRESAGRILSTLVATSPVVEVTIDDGRTGAIAFYVTTGVAGDYAVSIVQDDGSVVTTTYDALAAPATGDGVALGGGGDSTSLPSAEPIAFPSDTDPSIIEPDPTLDPVSGG